MNSTTATVTEQDITVIRTSDGRSAVKVLVIERSAGGKLLTCVRLDGMGNGNRFVVESRQEVKA